MSRILSSSLQLPRARVFKALAPGLALGLAGVLLLPASETLAFTKIGQGSGPVLNLNQRDFRVFNNFQDAATNNNTTQDPQFPGWDGAEMAIWKACIEWGSIAHGNGSGDPTQSNLGDGGANFDAHFAGGSDGIGPSGSNIHSAIQSCQSGVLAFTEVPTAQGWRIRYCDSWTWHDGPGDNSGGFDLQGVACHEYGHALGLGHSATNAATMFPSTSGGGSSNNRSIHSDDSAGVQCIYGVILGSFKPVITSVSRNGNQITITGTNFSVSSSEVWFTNKNLTESNRNPTIRVGGLSATNGGTRLTLTIPDQAGPGDILVRRDKLSPNALSNAFPFDGTGSGPALTISSVSPSSIPNLIPGTAQTITVTGTGFTAQTKLELDGTRIEGSLSVPSANMLTFEWEPSTLGAHVLTVVESAISDSIGITVVANATPALQVGTGDAGNVVSGSTVVVVGGQPAELHYVVVSASNAPSVLPGKISLGLGNFFAEIFEVGLLITDADGLASIATPLTGIANVTLYWQSLRVVLPVASNYPMQESNLQSTFTP